MRSILKQALIIGIILLLSYLLIYDLVAYFHLESTTYQNRFLETSQPIYLFESLSSKNKMYLAILFSSYVITPIIGQILLLFELDKLRKSYMFGTYSKVNIAGVVGFICLILLWLYQHDTMLIKPLFYTSLPIYVLALIYTFHKDIS